MTDQVQEWCGSKWVMRNGSQTPNGVRTRPVRPSDSTVFAGSTAVTLGPHWVHPPVDAKSSHAASGVAAVAPRADLFQ